MKCQLSKEYLDKIRLVTFLVPTHNRKELLSRCLNSIKNLFGNDCNVIVCDNSSKEYESLLNVIINEKYIDLRNYEANIQKVYKTLIENVLTKYCIFVEDDDQLVNIDVHLKCIDRLFEGHKVVTFGAYDNNEQYMLREFVDQLINIPFFWNGEFQFGMAYFEINALKNTFYKWTADIDTSLIINSDEAITLITAIDQKDYIHIPELGMKIGILNDNLSWNNFELSAYSAIIYIDLIQKILNINDIKWKEQYLLIIKQELKTLYKGNKNFDNVFLVLRKYFRNKINYSISKIYQVINFFK